MPVQPIPDRGPFLGLMSALAPMEVPRGGARVQTNLSPVHGDRGALEVRRGVKLINEFDPAGVEEWAADTPYVLGDIRRWGRLFLYCWRPHTSASVIGNDLLDQDNPYWTPFFLTEVSVQPSYSSKPEESLPVVTLLQGGGPWDGQMIGFRSFKPRILVPWSWSYTPPTFQPPGDDDTGTGAGTVDYQATPSWVHFIVPSPSGSQATKLYRVNVNPFADPSGSGVADAFALDLWTIDQLKSDADVEFHVHAICDKAGTLHWAVWQVSTGAYDEDEQDLSSHFGVWRRDDVGGGVSRWWLPSDHFDELDEVRTAVDASRQLIAVSFLPDGRQYLLGDGAAESNLRRQTNQEAIDALTTGGWTDAVWLLGPDGSSYSGKLLSRDGTLCSLRPYDGLRLNTGNPCLWPLRGNDQLLSVVKGGDDDYTWTGRLTMTSDGSVIIRPAGLLQLDGTTAFDGFGTVDGDDKSGYQLAGMFAPMPLNDDYVVVPRGLDGIEIRPIGSQGERTEISLGASESCVGVCTAPARGRFYAWIYDTSLGPSGLHHFIREYDSTGNLVLEWDGQGGAYTNFNTFMSRSDDRPLFMCMDDSGRWLFLGQTNTTNLYVFSMPVGFPNYSEGTTYNRGEIVVGTNSNLTAWVITDDVFDSTGTPNPTATGGHMRQLQTDSGAITSGAVSLTPAVSFGGCSSGYASQIAGIA